LLTGVNPALYTVVDSGVPVSHLGPHGAIFNASSLNDYGSLGCVLTDDTTGKRHILSCWHVMKGDKRYDETTDNSPAMVEQTANGGIPLATRWGGGLQGPYDFAVAELATSQNGRDNSVIFSALNVRNNGYRELTNADINNTTPVLFHNIFGQPRTGKVLSSSESIMIKYDDKIRIMEDILVLTDDHTGQQKAMSQGGNSGAVIFDTQGFAIAMVIAGDRKYTYAMKLSNFFTLHKEMKIA